MSILKKFIHKEKPKKIATVATKTKGNTFAPTPYASVLTPYVTEKSSFLQKKHNTYVFKVDHRATTAEIKKEVARIFAVTVLRVNIISVHNKKIQVGRYQGHVPGFKKAMITLKTGDIIQGPTS